MSPISNHVIVYSTLELLWEQTFLVVQLSLAKIHFIVGILVNLKSETKRFIKRFDQKMKAAEDIF